MKIAIIGQKGIPASWGGVERHVEELAKRLVGFGHELLVYCRFYYVSEPQKVIFEQEHPGIRLIFRSTIRSKHLDTITHTFFSILHAMKEDVDLYHFHSVGPSLLSWIPRLFRPHARVITTFHSPDRLHQKWGRIARWCLMVGEQTAVYFAHRTITVSRDLEQYCARRYHRKTIYIPNGVQKPEHRRASMITAQFGLQPQEYLLTVARLVPHKGIHHLIAAFKKLNTNKKLVIVGDAFYTEGYVQMLKTMAASDPRILFVGYQTGEILQELFSNCALYVQPSESEGLSIALLEAASYGRPIIASDIPSNKEVTNGLAWLFCSGDVHDLQKVLHRALSHQKTLLGSAKKLQKEIWDRYNWDSIAEQTEYLYGEALERLREQASVSEDGRQTLREVIK